MNAMVITEEIALANLALEGQPREGKVCLDHDDEGEPTVGRRMPKDPETQQDMSEYFLGIDVGYSRRRATTGLFLITINKDLFKWQCLNTGTEHSRRQQILEELLPDGVNLTGVGIDGPLAANLQSINRYRISDALLSRGLFQSRCKPGATNSRTGQDLHHHATALARLVMDLKYVSLSPASHPGRVHDSAIYEAFPTAFLAVLLSDVEIDAKKSQFGRKKSDGYWEIAVRQGSLRRLIQALAPQRRLDECLSSIKNHDHRAAFVCALAALCRAKNMYVSVGDHEDGNIVLPSRDQWWVDCSSQKSWAWEGLKSNAESVRRRRGPCAGHEIEVICDGGKSL